MAGLLGAAPVSRETQLANDRHSPALVVLVLAFLCVYIYLFTQAADEIGAPLPKAVADAVGWHPEKVFDDDNVSSELYVPMTWLYDNDDERFVLFVGVAIAFLLVYFLPLDLKRPSLVISFCVIVSILYGLRGIAGLAASHAIVYLVLHPARGLRVWLAGWPGFLGYLALGTYEALSVWAILIAVTCGVASAVLYRYLLIRALDAPRLAPCLRVVATQSAMIVALGGAVWEGLSGQTFELALGVLLFFWHWERLLLYYVDYKDGQIPADISFWSYLSVFMAPGQIGNWNWGVTIGQGYAYCQNNFYCEDKNRLIVDGLRLWALSITYLVLAQWGVYLLLAVLQDLGFVVFSRNRQMTCHFIFDGQVTTSTVLLTSLMDLLRWTAIWGGVVHFKVGLWRICGYRIDPYFNYPWLSTNMVALWSRFTFHYREFLVKVFYYPVFFRCFRTRPYLRIACATFAAAGVGNMVWGHLSEAVFYKGVAWGNIAGALRQWPYFVLLSLGITVAQFWLMRKKRDSRKPWTFDRRIVLDAFAAYVTLQFYALIHVFYHYCQEGTTAQHFKLFLIGFGIGGN
ncbi:MAG: hypothetical protein G3M78_07085 [Candidatus Nitrohelix vancouverensis]|uniref:MBOAT family protein n=1 Tax=Candidatus Nitrohelix vancouverensis TaxID=2705534 RepID=A0A7T0G388_9BACT|nr:MAG: hypothetical protein G3M78_07085 [Candidatus Nitrohelix vancouverensis]